MQTLFVQELTLLDVPAHMTLLDERPSGKLCVTYHKLTVVDAICEIRATTQRIPNLDIAKVSHPNVCLFQEVLGSRVASQEVLGSRVARS